ncbi:MAG: outer membrane protein assembly factor BamB family protein [Actinomycetota bacterium]
MPSVNGLRNWLATFAVIVASVSCSGAGWTASTSSAPETMQPTAGPPQRPSPLWTADLGGKASGLTLDDDTLYVTRARGGLVAFALECGSITCRPTWTGATGPTLTVQGVGSNRLVIGPARPIVGGGRVYVKSRDWKRLYVFASDCATRRCGPLWTARSKRPFTELTPIGGRVYAATWRGDVVAFANDCASGGEPCAPLWRSPVVDATWSLERGDSMLYAPGFDARLHAIGIVDGVERWRGPSLRCRQCLSGPVFAGRQVFISSGGRAMLDPTADSSVLFAFPMRCRDACAPSWTATVHDALLSDPAVGGDLVYVSTETAPGSGDGHLYAFARSCSHGNGCAPVWSAESPVGELGIISPTLLGDTVMVTSQEQSFVQMFPADCGAATCDPLWIAAGLTGPMPAVVADGYVYVATNDARVLAFDPACRTDGGVCAPSWEVRGSGAWLSPPVVTHGIVYTTSSDGTVAAYPAPGTT